MSPMDLVIIDLSLYPSFTHINLISSLYLGV